MKTKGIKICIILMALACSLLLSGFSAASRNVELKTDKPLINLDLLVKDSLPGKYGNPEAGRPGKTEELPREDRESGKDQTAASKDKEAETAAVTEIRVEIRDTRITVNGTDCANGKAAAARVKELYRPGLRVYLVDDYAGYQTYKELYDGLRSENISFTEVTED